LGVVRSQLNVQPIPSLRVPLSSRVLPSYTWPADRSPRTPLLGFLLPSALEGSEVHIFAGCTCPLRSAFRVWLPSWRFPPFDPVPVLFHTGSALGIYPSELSPLTGHPRRFRREGPTYRFFPADIPGTEVPSRLDRPRFLGFAPCESPWRRQACLAPQPLDAPLGFDLPGFALGSLDQDFARSPLTRFAGRDDRSSHRPASQSLNGLPAGPIPATTAS
jgi:hypothetical protein